MTSGYDKLSTAISWPDNGTAWIEQELCIDPLDVPVRYSLIERGCNGDTEEVEWQVSLTEDEVILRRKSDKVSHLPREIPYSDFSDVVLWGALAHNKTGDVMVGLSLYSRELDLQVPVCITADTEGLAGRWTTWSAILGVNPKVLDGTRNLRDPFQGIGKLATGTAVPRRTSANRLARGAFTDTSNVYQMRDHRPQSDARPQV